MQTWHFNISGQILIDGMEDKTMSIKPENIKTIIRISDYLNEFMPKFMMRLSIDKNLFEMNFLFSSLRILITIKRLIIRSMKF